MGYSEKVFAAGDDALGYEYSFVLSPLGALTAVLPDLTGLELRTKTISIPSQERGEYTYDYKTRTITKPNGKVTTSNEFTFEFRADKNYIFYKFFSAWLALIGSDSGASRDFVSGGSPIRTDMTVKTLDANGDLTGQAWNFTGCWIKSLGDISLDAESGDPVSISVTMVFLNMDSI